MLTLTQYAEVLHASRINRREVRRALIRFGMRNPPAAAVDSILEEIANHTERDKIYQLAEQMGANDDELAHWRDAYIDNWGNKPFVEILLRKFNRDQVKYILETIDQHLGDK